MPSRTGKARAARSLRSGQVNQVLANVRARCPPRGAGVGLMLDLSVGRDATTTAAMNDGKLRCDQVKGPDDSLRFVRCGCVSIQFHGRRRVTRKQQGSSGALILRNRSRPLGVQGTSVSSPVGLPLGCLLSQSFE
jgi:hypothetical protein